ncbi:glycosyltransferase 87 family protein [Homoserinibacter sp. GY 40078]|uniref:glycosyltransferase 87 family protein n=1 Tax=Homoserinibacter sp. GY 40078 TaxID=2603275 RepID=UPI00164FC668|nr:glycosyltransferase 87 family protein [Homoserinibacter sp. GY 40078]
MTEAAPASGARAFAGAFLTHPAVLWSAFVLVHLILGLICLTAPSLPMGDVTIAYAFWVRQGVEADIWVGIDTAWVYPIVALVPMLASLIAGWTFYASTWLTLVMAVDAIAFAVLLRRGRPDRATAPVAWWWLGFLLALGPVALGRIDSFATALAIVGALLVVGRPVIGSALLATAAWIKVWPAALVAAAVIALRRRLTVVATALAVSVIVLGVGVLLGGGPGLVSFITQQDGRGLQIESPLAIPAMWAAWAHDGTVIYYDREILTYQLQGQGVAEAAALSTPLLALAVAAISALGIVGAVRRRDPAILLPPLMLAFTGALILFNKVGSPQFTGWLAVPVIFGLVMARIGGGRSFRTPAVIAVVIAAFTQVVYPYLYGKLLALDTVLLITLTARNILTAVLVAWAVKALIDAVRSDPELS